MVITLRPLLQLGVLALGLWLAAVAAASTLSADVDRRQIDENDILVLEVRYAGDGRTADLDFARLDEDFVILNQQRAQQISLIRGRPRTATTWTLTLQPKRRGTLRIPAFETGGAATDPITVLVTAPTPEARRQLAELVFMETEVSAETVRVQEQFVYRVRLFYAEGAALYGEVPQAPQFADTLVEPLGPNRNRTELRGGRRYQVIERAYAVVPQRSGELRLPPESFFGALRVTVDGALRRRNLQVATDGHAIDVRPRPAEWPNDAPWLPARELDLRDAFNPPLHHDLASGEPVHRTVILQARGVAASALPVIDFGVTEGGRLYPEPPVLDQELSAAGFMSTRIQSALVIPERGHLTLPEVGVLWWDLDTEEIRRAVIPGRRLPVAASRTPLPAPFPADSQSETVASSADNDNPVRTVRPWPATILAAIGLWSATLLLWWWSARRRARLPADPDKRLSVPKERQRLEQACRSNDPTEARSALERWIQASDSSRAAAGDRMLHRLDPDMRASLAPLLADLDHCLYGRDGKRPGNDWSGAALGAWVRNHARRRPSGPWRRPAALPDLYPRSAEARDFDTTS